jgi:hypothetical protein
MISMRPSYLDGLVGMVGIAILAGCAGTSPSLDSGAGGSSAGGTPKTGETKTVSSEPDIPKEFQYRDKTPVRVSEIHFDPSADQGKVEFIEISNVSKEAVDLSGWQVTGAGRVALPKGTRLEPGASLVLCQDLDAFPESFPRAPKAIGLLLGKLKNSGETVRIEDSDGLVADEASFEETEPEVIAAAGTGLSLERARVRTTASAKGIWRAVKPSPGSFSTKARN